MQKEKNRGMQIHHFSHEHPLVFHEQKSYGDRCSACDRQVIGPEYCCSLCGFYLHKSCAELPATLVHPFHPHHTVTLLAKSPYPDVLYMCDMCNKTRKGFPYHCSVCGFNLDTTCAFRPKRTFRELDLSRRRKSIAEASAKKYLISNEEIRKPVLKTKAPVSEQKDLVLKNLFSRRESRKTDTVGGKKSSIEALEEKIKAFEGKKQKGETGKPLPYISRSHIFNLKLKKPNLVSIGPYHRDEEHQLDKYKHSFLEKLLSRTSNNPDRDLSFYVQEIIALEEQARGWYFKRNLAMSSPDFVKMMILDGCFIIELLRQFHETEGASDIFMPWQFSILVEDLLMLENQIPFFVLQKLFDLSKNDEAQPEVSLTTMALKFFDLALPPSLGLTTDFSFLKPTHLLDLFVKTIALSKILRPPNGRKGNLSRSLIQMSISNLQDLIIGPVNLKAAANRGNQTQYSPFAFFLIEGIAGLRKAGIEFMPSRANNFLDFNFKHGVIEIPQVTVDNLFSTMLVNSMALEEWYSFRYRTPKLFNNYVYFMTFLIKKDSDVRFLRSKGIISGFSVNDQKVADLFNSLRRSGYRIDYSDSQFGETIAAIESYVGQSRRLWEAISTIGSYIGQSRTRMRQFLMETSVVYVIFFATTLVILCLCYLHFIPAKKTQFLAVCGNTNLICILSLQRSWRRVLRNPVQVTVIISTFFANILQFLLPSLG